MSHIVFFFNFADKCPVMKKIHQLFCICGLLFSLLACESADKQENIEGSGSQWYIPKYAKYFKISYQDGNKTIYIINPWGQPALDFSYTVSNSPAEKLPMMHDTHWKLPYSPKRVVCMSSPSAGLLVNFDWYKRIIGVTDERYIYNSKIREGLAQGEIENLGANLSFNMERVLLLKPDLVINSGWDNLSADMRRLQRLQIPVFYTYEWKESHPLGKAEWMIAVAALLGDEQKAIQQFDSIAEIYNTIKMESAKHKDKPLVFTGAEYQGIWHSAAGKSYMAQLIRDAGGEYLFENDSSSGSITVDFEVLLSKALDADIWIYSGGIDTLSLELLKKEKYQPLKAMKTAKLYSYHARQLKSGANDYWETSMYNPHIVLRDLQHLFFGNNSSDYQPYYFAKIILRE